MKILSIRILRGPNYWSGYRKKLVAMKLDLGEYEDYPTHKIPGFAERLEKMLPSMYEHECSINSPGGFFERVREGTWMGHVVEHIALELQSLAGMSCGYGRTRSTGKRGVYHVVFAYEIEAAGVYAAEAAVRVAAALREGREYDLKSDLDQLELIRDHYGPGPSTKALMDEAKRRKIPFRLVENNFLLQLGYGKYRRLLQAAVTDRTGLIGSDIAADKAETKRYLACHFMPVPEGSVISDEKDLNEAVKKLGFPIVIKPLDGNHGRGVSTNLQNEDVALKAFRLAKKISDKVIVERYVAGTDFRFLVINYKVEAVAKRSPAKVKGDGKRTTKELIEEVNSHPGRGDGHGKLLTRIPLDQDTEEMLARQKLTYDSVIPEGQTVILKSSANLSSGGTAKDVTDIVHPQNIALAERIARLMTLDICGIDVIASDITKPLDKENGAVIEVNAGPGLRMHLSPSKGVKRNVAKPIIDLLFPGGEQGRIPIIAVTGTNGKTTTTRLIAHIAATSGRSVGFTTTDGIYINNSLVYSGDCSGPASAETILSDPMVDFAVLECARGGILRSGLGFDKCEVGIVTNITEDHLGIDDIDTLDQLARVKKVVVQSVKDDGGYAILNADDERVYAMRSDLDCNIALFSIEERNPRMVRHLHRGGKAALIEDGYFTIAEGGWRTPVAKVDEVPLTLGGTALSMVKNVLPAILASYVSGFDIRTIRNALMTFIPGPETTPGRMNIFSFGHFEVMIDYAHNRDGMEQLECFLRSKAKRHKVGVIASPGDRRDEDIRNVGFYSAKMFDEIIIKLDKDGRGRTDKEIIKLLKEGIQKENDSIPVRVIPDELDAINDAIEHASQGDFIVVCTDNVKRTIAFIKERQKGFVSQTQATINN